MMLSFLKPKYFMPVHGEYLMLKEHARIAQDLGYKNTFVLNRGDVLSINDKTAKIIPNDIITGNVYLNSNLDVVNREVIIDRKILANEGLISITYTLSQTKESIQPPKVISKGFVDVHSTKEIMELITKRAETALAEVIANRKIINKTIIETEITQLLSSYIYQKIERRPLILVRVFILGTNEEQKTSNSLNTIFTK